MRDGGVDTDRGAPRWRGRIGGGLDLNPGMLAVAARNAPDVDWRQGAAESLPYKDGASALWPSVIIADREAALREMVRVLAPGGHLAVAVFAALENIPAYAAMAALVERFAGKSPADAFTDVIP